MTRTRSLLRSPEPLLEEHSRLWKLVERCRSTLHETNIRSEYLNSLFRRLLEQLLNHFSHEEEHGYFSDLIEEAPQLESTVEELYRQHPRMVELIVWISNEMENREPGEERRCRLTSIYDEFYHLFKRHEAEETLLLQNAFNSDLGGHD